MLWCVACLLVALAWSESQTCNDDLRPESDSLLLQVQKFAKSTASPDDMVDETPSADSIIGKMAQAVEQLHPDSAVASEAEKLEGGEDQSKTRQLKEELDVLNKASADLTPDGAERAGTMLTGNTLAKITGKRSEDDGCKHPDPKMCFQGDMLASSKEQLLLFQNRHSGLVDNKYVAAGKPWTDATVKYCFAADINPRIKHLFEMATEQYVRAVPCMKFVNVGNAEGHKVNGPDSHKACDVNPAIFVMSRKDDGCWSFVGELSGSINGQFKTQLLNLQFPGCDSLGTAIHELGHAIGMAHEQSRPDREKYVKILWDNIEKAEYNNFEIDEGGFTGQDYDFHSVMHYDAYAFTNNGKPTIEAKSPGHGELGQRIGLSQYDVDQVGEMYKEVKSNCKAGSINEALGCKDSDDKMCKGLSKCTNTDQLMHCCACGGGTEYQCYSNGSCNKRKLVEVSPAACIMDVTADFPGETCVVQNGCSYPVSMECPSLSEGMWLEVAASSGPTTGPSIKKICGDLGKGKCTIGKSQ